MKEIPRFSDFYFYLFIYFLFFEFRAIAVIPGIDYFVMTRNTRLSLLF